VHDAPPPGATGPDDVVDKGALRASSQVNCPTAERLWTDMAFRLLDGRSAGEVRAVVARVAGEVRAATPASLCVPIKLKRELADYVKRAGKGKLAHHVEVAQRMMPGARKGDDVPVVKCVGGWHWAHVDECAGGTNVPDHAWYIAEIKKRMEQILAVSTAAHGRDGV
jgi:hypothetical protein